MKGDVKPFIDTNTLNKDGNIGLDSSIYAFSDDGLILAYELIESGSDWRTVHFKHVEKGDIYKDKLERVKFTQLSWTKDNKGIFYAGFREKKGKADGSENDANKNKKLYYHVLGTEQSEDIVVAEFPNNPDYVVDGRVSNCGNYLIVNPAEGSDNNLILIADIRNGVKTKPELEPIISKMEANYFFIANNENQFIFLTNKDADNYKLISIDITNPNPDPKCWKEIVPEDKNNKLEFAKAVHDKYVVLCYTENVKSALQLHDITSGKMIKKFQLDIGTVNFGSFFGDRKTPHVFFNFESFLTPGITYHCDLSKETFDLEVIHEIKLKDFDREQFTVDQVFYESTDKTKIPMYIVYKKGLKKDGTSFAFLTGYGGFSDSILPYFVVNRLVVISNFDGFHCVANIRGGGEYGEKWHRDGSREKKQNSFNDFQAGAEFLINEKYTNNKLLSVSGGSNGGLLMGACLNQRPDLFGVVFAEVGVMDMLRYDKFTDGHEWVTEYGSASDPKFFPILYKYSPLHNVRIPDQADKQYPAVMLATADHDDRVSPLHSLKFAATLQYEATKHINQKNPFIIRIEKDAGHYAGNSLDKELI
ncbi:prolyl endopeptidase-like [Planococcus citri]|uniref:prolyl endopeptidase-like n=1 Tax=Planococcus citri TaxID=170843 RepID=UPI0031F8005A